MRSRAFALLLASESADETAYTRMLVSRKHSTLMEIVTGPGALANLRLRVATDLLDASSCPPGVRFTQVQPLEEIADQGVQRRRPLGGDPPGLAQGGLVERNGHVLHPHMIRVTVSTDQGSVTTRKTYVSNMLKTARNRNLRPTTTAGMGERSRRRPSTGPR